MTGKSIFLILLLIPFFQLSNMVEVQAEEIYQSDFILENVFLDNENLVQGKETKIWAMMKNMGTERPDDFHIAFYVNDIFFDEKSIKSKPKGHSVTANTKSWEYPGGIVTIKACADPNNVSIEKNEDNNCHTIKFPAKQEITITSSSKMIVSNLSIDVTPSIIQEGVETSVTVQGKLTDTNSGIGISGKSVLVGHPKNNVNVVTDSEGYYSHTFSVTVKSGTWSVSALFNGDNTVRGSNTSSSLGAVNYTPPIEEPPLELPILTDDVVTTPVEPTLPDDTDSSAEISFLNDEDIISTYNLLTTTESAEGKVPEWVRTMAGWWADELTTDQEFADAIKFLAERGIVQVQA